MEKAIKDVMSDVNKAIKAKGLTPRSAANLEHDAGYQVSFS